MFIEYTWLIPVIPLLMFVIIGLTGTKGSKTHGGYVAILGALLTLTLSALVIYEFLTGDAYSTVGFVTESVTWFSIGSFEITLGYYVDGLTCIMLMFSTIVSFLIFVYSIGYMGDQEKRQRRYFAEVSLFLAGMTGLIIANNYLMMFIFWEVMGLCSYLLIGFWSFKHPQGDDASDNASSAAKKAFLVTRLGDVSFMAGLFVLLFAFQSLDFTTIFDPSMIAAVNPDLIIVAALLLFGGAIGKSAQFPLQDWLPDAMAGPTTVSALIHAATMVKAGVYLVARSFPLFTQSMEVMLVVGLIGGVTALLAASMALSNNNIKKVLAFSTISQLGYMFLALGAGGYMIALGIDIGTATAEGAALVTLGTAGFVAGVFHMFNHAFFKAQLFLGSGSVIHSTGTEDMREMGGLRKKMKTTSITMLIGSLSIAGFPFFSGFWSKDLVLDSVLKASEYGPEGYIFAIIWVMGIITVFMTAFYMFRMWYMTFGGPVGPATETSHGESPASMTVPLWLLAIFAFASGFLLLFGLDGLITSTSLEGLGVMYYLEHMFLNPYTYVSIILALVGIFVAYLMYSRFSLNPGKFNKEGTSKTYKAIEKSWGFPRLYNWISWTFGYGIGKAVDSFDKNVIDGTVNGLSGAVVGSGEAAKYAQTGNVGNYASIVMVGVAVIFVAALLFIYYMGGM
ncbi:MAG TPA: proton-conducting transporter membrane subunit [Candidatus Methanomethylophilaceae archaeon]|nr:proton-conducting transporter membrane subunit [Candidatus Methanomethylophilaceae archaeon]